MPLSRLSRPLLGIVLLTALVACGEIAGRGGGTSVDAALPVITPQDDWEAVPAAEVNGPLVLEEGCLLLDADVVFWPHGSRWDSSARAVVLEGGQRARVGETFKGGGGSYGTDTDFPELVGDEAAGAISRCVAATGATEVVFAYGAGAPGAS